MFSPFQKKLTRFGGSTDRIDQVKKTKFEIELIKIEDCSLDGRGNYTSNIVPSKKKSLLNNLFLNSKDICIYQLILKTINSSHPSGIQVK